MVLIHGGGWADLDKSTMRNMGQFLARSGLVAFSVDYRLSHGLRPQRLATVLLVFCTSVAMLLASQFCVETPSPKWKIRCDRQRHLERKRLAGGEPVSRITAGEAEPAYDFQNMIFAFV